MELGDLRPLQHITTCSALASIAEWGLLSRSTMKTWREPTSGIADPSVLNRRMGRALNVGGQIDDYAPLYFNARNAMLYRALMESPEIVVLDVNPGILLRPGVRITRVNASSGVSAHDRSVIDGLPLIQAQDIYRDSWTQGDQAKRRLQAEVLIPRAVEPEEITCVRVPTGVVADRVREIDSAYFARASWDLRVDPYLFFQSGGFANESGEGVNR